MTENAQPLPPSGGSRATTGFVIIEDMLTEYGKTGRCATLARWVGEAKERLDQFRRETTVERDKRDADRVWAAYEAAQELVCGIHEGRIKRH